MALKDLLPPGTFDEITAEANGGSANISADASGSMNTSADASGNGDVLMVTCPYCKKRIAYSTDNPFRPFCSERCRLLDLSAWANEEHVVAGKDINLDEDADLLNDPNLPVRHIPKDDL